MAQVGQKSGENSAGGRGGRVVSTRACGERYSPRVTSDVSWDDLTDSAVS